MSGTTTMTLDATLWELTRAPGGGDIFGRVKLETCSSTVVNQPLGVVRQRDRINHRNKRGKFEENVTCREHVSSYKMYGITHGKN